MPDDNRVSNIFVVRSVSGEWLVALRGVALTTEHSTNHPRPKKFGERHDNPLQWVSYLVFFLRDSLQL